MAECKNCIHENVCKYADQNISVGTKIRETIHGCSDYKDNSDVVEVVRCKNCENYSGKYCRLTDDTEDRREPDDYCSYGTPKERE